MHSPMLIALGNNLIDLSLEMWAAGFSLWVMEKEH